MLALAVCLLLADCAHVPPTPPPSPPARPHAPARAVATAPPVLSERELPEGLERANRTLAQGGQGAVAAQESGYFLDVLQGRLLQRVGNRFAVIRRDDAVVLRPTAGSQWFTADGVLAADGAAALAQLAGVLAEYRRSLVIVRVAGSDEAAARQRALAVQRQLAAGKLDRRRILAVVVSAAAPTLELQVEPVVVSR